MWGYYSSDCSSAVNVEKGWFYMNPSNEILPSFTRPSERDWSNPRLAKQEMLDGLHEKGKCKWEEGVQLTSTTQSFAVLLGIPLIAAIHSISPPEP